MKLLIVTQKVSVDDPILGFFHSWIAEFAKHSEKIFVICLEEGKHHLPENVRVYSLGKEKGASRIEYAFNFYRYIWSLRNDYDTVFVHMNPEYVVLGGELWKILGKKIALWYTHRERNLKLRIAAFLSDVIFTAAKESFTLQSSKVRVVGHGIDSNKFPRVGSDFSGPVRIVHLGRITKIKNIGLILKASKLLLDQGLKISEIRLVGPVVTAEDSVYKAELVTLAEELGLSNLVYWDESNDDAKAFDASTITINAAPHGGMDKAVLGALAAGRPAFVANKAFETVYGSYSEVFYYELGNAEDLARKVSAFLSRPKDAQEEASRTLEDKVRLEYDVRALIGRIISELDAKSL